MDVKRDILSVKFDKYEQLNDSTSRVKVYIMYAGKNRNNSFFTKEAIESAVEKSLYGIPVVGEFKKEIDNFGGHGGRIEIDSEGMRYIETTKPYGFIPFDKELSDKRWEKVEDEYGNSKEYLVVNAYLWRRRYPELDVTFEQGSNQSMEILVDDSYVRDDNYFDITDFRFDALCILGKDEEDLENNTEPCFEDSKVDSYSLNKDEFKLEFSTMVEEIKMSLGGESMKDEKKDEVVEDVKIEETKVEDVKESFEEDSKVDSELDKKEEFKEELDTKVEVEDIKVEDVKVEDVKIEDFSLTMREKLEEMNNVFDNEPVLDSENECIENTSYYAYDFNEEYVYAYRWHWVLGSGSDDDEVRVNYNISEEDIITLDMSTLDKIYIVRLTKAEKDALENSRNEEIMGLKSELEVKNDDFERVSNELNEYKVDERKSSEDAIFSLYEKELKDDPDFDSLKEKSSEYSLEQLEKELAFILVKKTKRFSKADKKEDLVKISYGKKKEAKGVNPYEGL